MKLFVCADIEGCCGITDWSETQPGSPQSEAFRKQMTEEVAAVCRGALEAGFDRVVVRDAHDSARNLLPELLPEQTRIYRGWTGDPYGMLSGLDGSFAGVVFTGFHSPARTGGSPLAHTMDTGLYEVRLNGRIASEFLLNAYAAARIGVPVLMLTGDYGICFDAEKELPTLPTVCTQVGNGGGTLSLHPARGGLAHRAHGRDGSDARVRSDGGGAATAGLVYARGVLQGASARVPQFLLPRRVPARREHGGL